MALVKIASPSDWSNISDAFTGLVKVSSAGLMPGDAAILTKLAGDRFVHEVKQIEDELKKNCAYVHATALGASDFFGPNRNGDGWRADVLERDLPTYVKHGKLFRDHNNKADSPHYGRIKLAFFDRDRGYGRVLMEYNATQQAADQYGGKLADREMQKLAKDGQLAVSIGTNVGSDTCVICGNVATKRAEYCLPKKEGGTCDLFGCRHGLSKVSEDGRIQFVDNPKNVFYDLSDVGTPADRIAYAVPVGELSKTASFGEPVQYELPPRYDLLAIHLTDVPVSLVKAALYLAEVEDRISAASDESFEKLAFDAAVAGDPAQPINIAGLVHPDPYVRRGTAYKLAMRRECPSAGQMAKAAGFNNLQAEQCDTIAFGLLNRLVCLDKLGVLLKTSDFTLGRLAPHSHPLAMNAAAPGYSFDDRTLTKRAHLQAITGPTPFKAVDVERSSSEQLAQLACDYVAMKIAMASQFFMNEENTLHLIACPRRS